MNLWIVVHRHRFGVSVFPAFSTGPDLRKKPVEELKAYGETIDASNPEMVQTLVGMVVRETEEVLAALRGLEEEIQELEAQQEQEQSVEMTLQDLESKFQKHFQELREEEKKAGRVQT